MTQLDIQILKIPVEPIYCQFCIELILKRDNKPTTEQTTAEDNRWVPQPGGVLQLAPKQNVY